jgi:hypothetical protein
LNTLLLLVAVAAVAGLAAGAAARVATGQPPGLRWHQERQLLSRSAVAALAAARELMHRKVTIRHFLPSHQ